MQVQCPQEERNALPKEPTDHSFARDSLAGDSVIFILLPQLSSLRALQFFPIDVLSGNQKNGLLGCHTEGK